MSRRRAPTLAAAAAWALLACAAAAAAPWSVQPVAEGREIPRAAQVNAQGDAITVYRDTVGDVYLEFLTPPGFNGLVLSNCPTFQVDDRLPLHHFEVGRTCEVDARRAVYGLGRIRGGRLVSLVTHRLMNGGVVAFRYATSDGSYHESTFALTGSKRALQEALGGDIAVAPE